MKNQLLFDGNSGCRIELIDDHTVRKISSSISYNERLKKQFKKQNIFPRIPVISSPQVSYGRTDDGLVYGDMDFILGQSFIQYFQLENFSTIKNRFEIIFDFVQSEIDKSTINIIDKELFIKKFDSMKLNYSRPDFISVEYPIGGCHGDLTLSNMLFTSDKIYFIDFLDSFLESPYQDLIKLRQDLVFKWSFVKTLDNEFDKNKVSQILYYLNEMLFSRFSTHITSKGFKQLEMMNYFRILPYCTEEKTKLFILNVLKEFSL